MKNYAEVFNGDVLRVITIKDTFTEDDAQSWLTNNVSSNTWIFAGKDKVEASRKDSYHADISSFIKKQPFQSWTLNKSKRRYEPPKSRSISNDEDYDYIWDESIIDWVLVRKSI